MINLLHGDCLERLRELPSDSLDSLVTDPPAGISFMGKDWDKDKGGRTAWVAWMTEVMRECLRVLKPGAHGLVWAIPRTSHWMAWALEDAGFEVRDVVTHLFGSGFPKSLDVSKAIDKAAGAKREVLRTHVQSQTNPQIHAGGTSLSGAVDHTLKNQWDITVPATDAAKQWQGFGTSLKPASEHWILVRRPLGEKTVAANVLKYGTGALNIDGCRIEGAGSNWSIPDDAKPRTSSMVYEGKTSPNSDSMIKNRAGAQGSPLGRFPANLVLSHNDDCELVGTKEVRTDSHWTPASSIYGSESERASESGLSRDGKETVEAWNCVDGCAVAELDRQSGVLHTHAGKGMYGDRPESNAYGKGWKRPVNQKADSGGASRFFYVAKASKSDRNRKAKTRGE